MTNKKALEYMENEIRCVQRSKYCDRDCAKCVLVKEDKPLIEAYGVAISALEKQIPKKPIETDKARCIHCACVVKRDERFCKNCGQALDWGDTK